MERNRLQTKQLDPTDEIGQHLLALGLLPRQVEKHISRLRELEEKRLRSDKRKGDRLKTVGFGNNHDRRAYSLWQK